MKIFFLLLLGLVVYSAGQPDEIEHEDETALELDDNTPTELDETDNEIDDEEILDPWQRIPHSCRRLCRRAKIGAKIRTRCFQACFCILHHYSTCRRRCKKRTCRSRCLRRTIRRCTHRRKG